MMPPGLWGFGLSTMTKLTAACVAAADGAPEQRIVIGRLPVPDIPADVTTPEHCAQHLVPMMAAFQYLGEPINYAYLAGVSGEAFRFVCDPTRFFPTFCYCSEDVWENACRALGYESEVVRDLGASEAVERIRSELAAGHVVLTNGLPGLLRPQEAWCAVGGIDPDNDKLLLRTCYELPRQHPWGYKAENYDPETGYLVVPIPREDWYATMVGPYFHPRCGLFVIGDKTREVDHRQVVLEALERAVLLAQEGESWLVEDPDLMAMIAAVPDPVREWSSVGPRDAETLVISSGFSAYVRWTNFLRGAPDPAKLTDATFMTAEMLANRLWESRGLAAAFLREVAPLLGGEASARLLRAAAHYDAVSKRFYGRDCALRKALLENDQVARRYQQQHPGPWGQWPFVYTGLLSPVSRQRVASELLAGLESERTAIDEIQNALQDATKPAGD